MRYRDNPRELLDPSYRAAALARESAAPSDLTGDVRRIVAKSLGVSDETILETSSLRDLGVNSLDLVVLVMAIEERFRIEFDPSDLERLRTFGELARRVHELAGVR
jgi:acyl carrier protein